MRLKLLILLCSTLIGAVLSESPTEKCIADGWTVIDETSEKPICFKAFVTNNDLTYDEAATMCNREDAQPAPMQNDVQKNAVKRSNQHEDCLMFPWSITSGGTAKWHDVACDCKKEDKCLAKTGGIVCAKFANQEEPADKFVEFPCDVDYMCDKARRETLEFLDKLEKGIYGKLLDERLQFIEDNLSGADITYECINNKGPDPQWDNLEPPLKLAKIANVLNSFKLYTEVTNFEQRGSRYAITLLVNGKDEWNIWTMSTVYITFSADFKVREFTFAHKIHDCKYVKIYG